ncbi:MAG: SMC-Scp complex subunit ScpB [Candidatus Buchananbacteria bacterium RBG_13_36_9]|uniref:SMC-Scp complex subunit ScpB n=1 Tax=Candidatus Buchananbacteria bacterium RBG_13_36_9 TaxID=1797530 RepID=A0A1G1XSP3_9BACT|nr:MAG: SMC-Scp complex subunit ScpB [Candidatus Buchananbacteria bacterium RBG_13_36_9]
MSLKSKIESILFISVRPLSSTKIAELVAADKEEVKQELDNLFTEYNQKDKGINLQKIGSNYQMVSNAENSKLVSEFLKEEVTGELTPASLETLTVIAYRGPITRAELEMIRGVNCSIILRNLSIRGLIEEIEDKKNLVTKYQMSFDFLKHLGITESSQLPDYEKLNSQEAIEKLLSQRQNQDIGEEK